MAAAIDAMEQRINLQDRKFEEKLALCREGNMAAVGSNSDRSYNLRQQIAHNAQLTTDDHFMTMLEETERKLAPDYTLRGELDKKLFSMLAGLLKQLLRETIGLPNFSLRKIQIEMVWQWNEDKKMKIVEFMQAQEERLKAAALAQEEADEEDMQIPIQQERSSPLVAPTAEKHPRILGKEGKSAFEDRLDAFNDPQSRFNTEPVLHSCHSLRFTEEAARGRERAVIAKKLCLYKKRNLLKSEKLRQEIRQAQEAGSEPVAYQARVVYTKDAKAKRSRAQGADPEASSKSTNDPSGPPTFIHHDSKAPQFDPDPKASAQSLDTAIAQAQKRWVSHMTQRLEDAQDQRHMTDMMTQFAFNQARIEEESCRRVEASTFASQTGRTCHTILRREQREVKEKGDNEPYVPVTVQSKLPSASLASEDVQNLLGRVVYQGADKTLSPYDSWQPSPLDETKLQSILSRVVTPDAAFEKDKARLGLKTTHPRSLASTSKNLARLDVTLASDAVVTPEVPRVDKPLIDMLRPALAVEDDVPSLARMEQMKMVERIRECFARAKGPDGQGFQISRAVLERAMISPDDRPYSECIQLLPTRKFDLPSNPFQQNANKKEKKKGKKKAK